MRYSLKQQIIDYTQKGLKFVELEHLTKEEYDLIDENIKVIDLFFHVEDYFLITEKNFNDLITYIEKEYEKCEENGLETFLNEQFLRESRIEVNKLLLNYLSSSRTFIDHTSRIVKDMSYKVFTSRIYDENFSYRFCSRLRNYAQHSGLPLTYFGVVINELQTKQMCFMFDIKHLLSDYNSWSKVKKDLVEFGDRKLDCKLVIDKYQDNLKEIDLVIVIEENPYSTKTRLISKTKIELLETKLKLWNP